MSVLPEDVMTLLLNFPDAQGRSELIHRRHTSLPNKSKQRWHGRHLSLPFFQPDSSVESTILSVVVLNIPGHDKDPTTPPDEVQLEVARLGLTFGGECRKLTVFAQPFTNTRCPSFGLSEAGYSPLPAR